LLRDAGLAGQGAGPSDDAAVDVKRAGIWRRTLFLEVRPSNTQAINLYDSLGFETVGLRRHYYPADQGREDALVMRYGL